MSTSFKTKAIAFGVMVGVGVALPTASWLASQPLDRLMPARARLAPAHIAVPEGFATPTHEAATKQQNTATVITTEANTTVAEEVSLPPADVIATPKPALKPIEAPKEKHCYWHKSQTLAQGAVWICDIERTPNHQQPKLLEPSEKPQHLLIPRDVPSPTGLTAQG